MQNKITKAFSISEIVIAIGIIGILTAVASVTYAKYSAKSQITAAIHVLDSYVRAAQDYYVENSTMPASISNIGGDYISTDKDSVSSVTMSSAGTNSVAISATFSSSSAKMLQNNNLVMQLSISIGGASSTGMFSVICNSPNIANAYLPTNCQS